MSGSISGDAWWPRAHRNAWRADALARRLTAARTVPRLGDSDRLDSADFGIPLPGRTRPPYTSQSLVHSEVGDETPRATRRRSARLVRPVVRASRRVLMGTESSAESSGQSTLDAEATAEADSRSSIKRVLIVTHDFADNSTGRAYSLWLLAIDEGWDVTVVSPKVGELWEPLRGTAFAAACRVAGPDRSGRHALTELARAADLIIAVKPLPGSFRVGLRLKRQTGTPLLLDIDDPDLESRTGAWNPMRMAAKAVLRGGQFWPAVALWPRTRQVPRIVSNPELARRHGGAVVPHARADSGFGDAHVSASPRVVFVGTSRKHKGLGIIRDAVAGLQDLGYTLTVTAPPPADAKPWEQWIGVTSLEVGLALVSRGDIVVLPSDPKSRVSAAQLPAKVIDAMLAGRAVVASPTQPLRWALGDAGVILKSADVAELRAALLLLGDPRRRSELGIAARERALALFSVAAVRENFVEACQLAAASRPAIEA